MLSRKRVALILGAELAADLPKDRQRSSICPIWQRSSICIFCFAENCCFAQSSCCEQRIVGFSVTASVCGERRMSSVLKSLRPSSTAAHAASSLLPPPAAFGLAARIEPPALAISGCRHQKKTTPKGRLFWCRQPESNRYGFYSEGF